MGLKSVKFSKLFFAWSETYEVYFMLYSSDWLLGNLYCSRSLFIFVSPDNTA